MKLEEPSFPKLILVTGGCGFIGSNFIKYLFSLDDHPKIVNIDKLTYAGNLENLVEVNDNSNYYFVKGDICDYELVSDTFDKFQPSMVVNFAAESHVDRSINNPQVFFDTNVKGTLNLLEISLHQNIDRFLQVSTDEVYGSLGKDGFFTEKTPISPNSPYSASKASADNFVRAYNKTYGLDTIITRCSNNYGPYQFPEKLIPLMINNCKNNEPLPIYGDGLNVRDWIHVLDHCKGIWSSLLKGRKGEIYNFGGGCELTNIEIVRKVVKLLDCDESLITFVEDRQGHDFRYAIDFNKAKKELAWRPLTMFDEGISETVNWYINNENWLSSIISGDYKKYYQTTYSNIMKN